MGGGPTKTHESFDVQSTASDDLAGDVEATDADVQAGGHALVNTLITGYVHTPDTLVGTAAGLGMVGDGELAGAGVGGYELDDVDFFSDGPEPSDIADVSGAEPEALSTADYEAVIDELHGLQAQADAHWQNQDLTLKERYEALEEFANEARAVLVDCNLDPADIKLLHKEEIAGFCRDRLNELDTNDLSQLAFTQGFEHPGLVGIHGGESPLVFWLNPGYDPSVAKDKIQAKANERYADLVAGGNVAGMTLADVHAQEAVFAAIPPTPAATPPPPPTPKPPISAGDFSALSDQLASNQCPVGYAKGAHEDFAANACAAADMLAKHDPPPGQEAEYAQAQSLANAQLQQAINHHYGQKVVDAHVADKVADGTLPPEVFALGKDLRTGVLTGTVNEHQLNEAVAAVQPHLAHVKSKLDAAKEFRQLEDAFGWGGNPGAYDISTPAGQQAFAQALAARENLVGLTQYCSENGLVSPTAVNKAIGIDPATTWTTYGINDENFRAWAKGQSIKDLRAVAEQLGLPEGSTGKVTKPNLQNYILLKSGTPYTGFKGGWKNYNSTEDMIADIEAKAGGPKPPATPKSTKTAEAQQKAAATISASIPVAATNTQTWGNKVATGAALVQTYGAAKQAVPARVTPQQFATKSFSKTSLPLPGGGSHERWAMTDEAGDTWMFKPDKSADGARGVAEAVASQAVAAGGVPNVPVYYHETGGKKGCIQPVVSGSSDLGGTTPSSMKQAEVDAVMKGSVALWMVGDHDAAGSNWIRTPNGGLAPVDQGQAFKFVGQDKMSSSYNPNAGYNGASLPNQVITAAKSGGLAAGVKIRPEAVVPVIERYESIPDSEWRAMIRPVAESGVKSGNVAWVGPMRNEAATKTGKSASSVTNDEVVDAFLDHMTERKKNLRSTVRKYLDESGADTSIFDLI